MSTAGERGTTLMEMLVVLAITVLIAGIVYPSIQNGVDGIALRETATVVAADLRAARADALRKDQTIAFATAGDAKSYGWTGGPVHIFPADIVAGGASAQPIYFYADGSASGGALIVRSRRGQITLHVDPASGAISMGGGA